MTDKQLAFKGDDVIRILNYAYSLFKRGQFSESIEKLEKALSIDYEYPGVTSSLKCANFWKEKQEKMESITDKYERGEFLISHWKHFITFSKRIGEVSEKCLFSIKQYIFGKALECYQGLYEESGIYDSDLLLHIGRCYKGIGNYEKAIQFLEIANQQKSGSPVILVELADCYAMINEDRASKVFFREAFFLDPQEIDLSTIETAAIERLSAKLREKGFAAPELLEWVPVYGTIFGVFNVKRELRPIEFGKLKQNIFRFESELKNKGEKTGFIVPRLINHYFWLIDHYQSTGEEKQRIDEVLEKLKNLDPVIYKEYTQ